MPAVVLLKYFQENFSNRLFCLHFVNNYSVQYYIRVYARVHACVYTRVRLLLNEGNFTE